MSPLSSQIRTLTTIIFNQAFSEFVWKRGAFLRERLRYSVALRDAQALSQAVCFTGTTFLNYHRFAIPGRGSSGDMTPENKSFRGAIKPSSNVSAGASTWDGETAKR
jgi:hypothetical protein